MKKLSIGIVGLPNVGKSTLFKLLTKQEVNIANYPFTTINPNVAVALVPDERLEKLAILLKPPEVIPAVVEFVDIAGLVKGAHKGAGLGNQFLGHIREVNALVMVLRAFKDETVPHLEGDINPEHDREILEQELKMAGIEKPVIHLINGPGGVELNQVPDLSGLIRQAYQLLNLITFFTFNEKELRAWSVKQGTKAPQAAGVIHTDFERGFIRAETIQWQKLLESGGWQQAKAKGLIRTEGKDYVVEDGDVMLIRHS